MATPSLEVTVIQAVAAYLFRIKGTRCRLLRVKILAKSPDGITTEETIKIPTCLQLTPQRQGEGDPEDEEEAEEEGIKEDILDALEEAGRPLKAAAIARRIGRSNSGHFRGKLGELKREGRIEVTDHGYRLILTPPGDEDKGEA